MLKTIRGSRIKATTVHVTLLPVFMVGLLVLADSCFCPLFGYIGQSGSITLPKSSPTASATASPPSPALVQHTFQHSQATTDALSFARDVGSGDLLLVAITSNQMSVTGVRDNQSDPPDAFQRVGQPLVATPANAPPSSRKGDARFCYKKCRRCGHGAVKRALQQQRGVGEGCDRILRERDAKNVRILYIGTDWMKGAGMRWTVHSAQSVATLRMFVLP